MASVSENFGRYRLVERIGYGGMAEVFRASYSPAPGFDKTLVVKRILPHLSEDPRFVNMFQDEAAITVHLSHPNIVQVFDFGTIGGIYFLAMEYVHGRNLRQLLRRLRDQSRPVPVGLAAYITAEVARGLAYAHDATDSVGRPLGIIHRDLNPPNILLSYQGGVKITDFGIAKATRRLEKTEAGRIKGKIEYTAPETLLGKDSDHRADLWALGCLLYEMLAGDHPFPVSQDDALAQKIIKITQEPYVPVSELRDGVPAPLERAVDLLLQKNPDDRPDTAAEIATVASAVVPPTARSRLGDMLRDLFAAEHAVENTPSSSAPSGKDFSIPSAVHRDRLEPSGNSRVRAEQPTQMTPPPVSSPSEPSVNVAGPSGPGVEGIEDAIAAAMAAEVSEPSRSVEDLVAEAQVPASTPPPRTPPPSSLPDPTQYSPPPQPPRSNTPAPHTPPPQTRPTPQPQRFVIDEPTPSRLPLILVLVLVPIAIGTAVFGWWYLNQQKKNQVANNTPTPTVTQVAVSPTAATPAPSPSPIATTATPTPRTPTPVPVQTARLTVDPSPSSANVTVNGKPYKSGQSYPVGSSLKIVVSAPGHLSWSRNVKMTSGGLDFSPQLAVAGTGTLKLTSQPWADVTIDGKRLGRQTPIYDLKLSAGPHKIVLVNNLENLRMEFTVVIKANQTTTKSANLRTKRVQ